MAASEHSLVPDLFRRRSPSTSLAGGALEDKLGRLKSAEVARFWICEGRRANLGLRNLHWLYPALRVASSRNTYGLRH